MAGIQEVLLNLLFILLPIFIYQNFWVDKMGTAMPQRNGIAIGSLSIASLLLCMTFPVSVIPGFVLDLRLVPMLIGILYGGWRVAVCIAIALFGYRVLIGQLGIGFLLMSISFPVVMAMAVLLAKRYLKIGRRQKLIFANLLLLLLLIPTNLIIMYSSQATPWASPYLPFLAFFTLINLLAVWLAVYLIENIREKAHLRVEVLRNEKLYVLGELAAAIAHEIRNPMTVVRGFLQLLQQQSVPPDKQLMYLELSIAELDRSESIISNYLAYAKPQIDKHEGIDVSERVRSVTGVISSYATLRSVTVESRIEDGLQITGNPEQFSQVLMNLFKNGIEAMPQGGTLQVRAYMRARQICLDIIDNGVGMTAAELARLGNPYYSTKENGTGLGLMVTYQIIHSMYGHVQVTSEKGKGTQFTLTFPQLETNALPE
ncbi:two-component system sporulation sensor kinase B [Tumebacillus sp. BK434]|uniref:ATP-binding protein n=1 Tax=Tumebacillus sp. BK434 TaxID=2512169 RepID=UPI001045B1B6|nr:ATP-binding protein [Tumebacillus sp. BK434]TCP55700.1 two-component system sporulation sensor kinase B [Tumebacillus sp. BK434]